MEQSVYLFNGENAFAVDRAIDKIAKGKNVVPQLIGDGLTAAEIIMTLNSPSLFAEQTIYLTKDENLLKEEGADVLFSDYLNNPSPFSTLIFCYYKKVDMRKKLPKLLKQKGCVQQFDLMKDRELEHWIKEYFWAKGYDIETEARFFLIEALGDDQNMLASEMEKIILFAPDTKILKVSDIKDIVTSSIRGNIFQLLDGLLDNQGEKLLKAYDALIKLKEPEVKILFMVIREFRLMLLTQWYVTQNKGKDFITKALKVHPFVAGRLINRSRKLKGAQIKSYLNQLYVLEEKIKTGKGEARVLLLSTLTSYSYQVKNG